MNIAVRKYNVSRNFWDDWCRIVVKDDATNEDVSLAIQEQYGLSAPPCNGSWSAEVPEMPFRGDTFELWPSNSPWACQPFYKFKAVLVK